MAIFGLMDGNVKIMKNIHELSREEIFTEPIHSKYVVRVKWGDKCFATASYDKTVNLYRLKEGSTEENPIYEHTQKWSFSGNVEAMEFTPDGIALIVAIRGDNYLNYIQLRDFSVIIFVQIRILFHQILILLLLLLLDFKSKYECYR